MSILDSAIAPYLFLLAGIGVLAGFFRKTLIKLVLFFLVEVLFLALFPKLLLSFVNLVSTFAHTLHH